MAQWYVLQTKARQEAVAERNLENQAFNTFLPWLQTKRRVKGRWQAVREPLFPGYLFVELNLERQNVALIRSTRGVLSLVRLGAKLQPFPNELFCALRKAQVAETAVLDLTKLLDIGDEVTLTDGPMVGLSAIFKARNSNERVVLLMDILGKATEVTVSARLLSKVG